MTVFLNKPTEIKFRFKFTCLKVALFKKYFKKSTKYNLLDYFLHLENLPNSNISSYHN